jgi:hypothetical protein
MLVVYLYIPESPWWCANRDQHERGRAVLSRLNGGIKGYDVDFHYGLIKKTVGLEREAAAQLHGPSKGFWHDVWSLRELFIGVNGVSFGILHMPERRKLTVAQFRTLVAFFPPATQQISGLAVVSLEAPACLRVCVGTDYSPLAAVQLRFLLRPSRWLCRSVHVYRPLVVSRSTIGRDLQLKTLPSLVSIGSTIVAFFMTDFVGRRATFLFGVVGTWSCLMIVGGLGLIKTPSLADNKLTVCTCPCPHTRSPHLDCTYPRRVLSAEIGQALLRAGVAHGIRSGGYSGSLFRRRSR